MRAGWRSEPGRGSTCASTATTAVRATSSLRPTDVRTCVRALGQPEGRNRGKPDPPGLPRTGGDPHVRRPGGDERPLLRGAGEVDPEPGAEGIADAVPVDDQSVSGMQPCVPVLHVG